MKPTFSTIAIIVLVLSISNTTLAVKPTGPIDVTDPNHPVSVGETQNPDQGIRFKTVVDQLGRFSFRVKDDGRVTGIQVRSRRKAVLTFWGKTIGDVHFDTKANAWIHGESGEPICYPAVEVGPQHLPAYQNFGSTMSDSCEDVTVILIEGENAIELRNGCESRQDVLALLGSLRLIDGAKAVIEDCKPGWKQPKDFN